MTLKGNIFSSINGGFYMSHVLLKLLNGLRKSDKMRGLPRILSLFRCIFNKWNNTCARMLDSSFHMTLKILCNRIIDVKTVRFCVICTQRCYGRH